MAMENKFGDVLFCFAASLVHILRRHKFSTIYHTSSITLL